MISLFLVYENILANNLKSKYDTIATMLYDLDEPIDSLLMRLMTFEK